MMASVFYEFAQEVFGFSIIKFGIILPWSNIPKEISSTAEQLLFRQQIEPLAAQGIFNAHSTFFYAKLAI